MSFTNTRVLFSTSNNYFFSVWFLLFCLKGRGCSSGLNRRSRCTFHDTKNHPFFLCSAKIRKASENKSTDRMRRGVQTRVVTNREFYELQTCRNGVALVCSGSYQCTGSRGGRELRKNGLIHFLHERVSLGQHQTSQSTQIYGPMKAVGLLTIICHHRLAAKTLTHLVPGLQGGSLPLLISSSGALLLPYISSSHHLQPCFSSPQCPLMCCDLFTEIIRIFIN